MKKILLVLTLTLALLFTGIIETHAADYTIPPTGKNYIDTDYFYQNEGHMTYTGMEGITVLKNTDYTLTMPFANAAAIFSAAGTMDLTIQMQHVNGLDNDLLTDISLALTSANQATHIVINDTNQTVSYSFNTGDADKIQINASFSEDVYTAALSSGAYFQLEEGLVSTAFEAYSQILPDTEKPVVSLNQSNVLVLEINTAFTYPAATWTDNVDGSGSDTVRSGTVDSSIPGEYVVTYHYTDAAGNQSDMAVWTVTVQDTTTPILTVSGTGFNEIEYLELGEIPSAISVSCLDAGEQCVYNSVGGYDNNTLGTYIITYSYVDLGGNSSIVYTRTIEYIDSTPIITLTGDTTIYVNVGESYIELGATYIDLIDGSGAAIASGSVDVDLIGTYTISYNITDTGGNDAITITRDVVVRVATVITIADTESTDLTLYYIFGGLSLAGLYFGFTRTDLGKKIQKKLK